MRASQCRDRRLCPRKDLNSRPSSPTLTHRERQGICPGYRLPKRGPKRLIRLVGAGKITATPGASPEPPTRALALSAGALQARHVRTGRPGREIEFGELRQIL